MRKRLAIIGEKEAESIDADCSESRLKTVATKISGPELKRLKSLALRRRQTASDLIHDLILAEFERDSAPSKCDPILTEVVGIRLLLVNLLKPRDAGQSPLTAAAFNSLLDEIKKVKSRIAFDIQREAAGVTNR